MRITTMLVDGDDIIHTQSVPVSFNDAAAKAVLNCKPRITDITPHKVVAYFNDVVIIVDDKHIELYNYNTMDLITYWYVRDYDYFVHWWHNGTMFK